MPPPMAPPTVVVTRGSTSTRGRPSESIEISASQTDASEWVEYETDMKELYETLKEEGIDVPLDENGDPILTPHFIKNLPPSVQPHAGGKKYAGGKPFKSTLKEPPFKGLLGRQSQTRLSIWEDYKKDLRKLYKTLEKNGVKLPRDENGVPILTETLLKSLPPEIAPHPAGAEFTPIIGVPSLPDGTRITPRLTLRLLNPPLQEELVKRMTVKGYKVPTENGRPSLTAEFIRTVPPEILTKVLEPIYDSQRRLSDRRKSVIKRLSLEEKNNLADLLEKNGMPVEKHAPDSAPEIPVKNLMQLPQEDITGVVGPERTNELYHPAPHKEKNLPRDTLAYLTVDQRDELGYLLLEQGITVDVDLEDVPIITKTLARLLATDIREQFGIVVDDDMADLTVHVDGYPAPVSEGRASIDSNINPRKSKEDKKRSRAGSRNLPGDKKSRIHLRTNKGLFRLTRKKEIKQEITDRLTAAGVEIIMTAEGELELSHVPDEIVAEFTTAIQSEIMQLDTTTLLERIHAMGDDDKEHMFEQLEVSGLELPKEEDQKTITVEFLDNLPREQLTKLLAKIFHSHLVFNDHAEDEEGNAETATEPEDLDVQLQASTYDQDGQVDDDWELELTDDQKEEFYEKLMDEGVSDVPIDNFTGRPKFTTKYLRNIPKKIAQEIIATAANTDGRRVSLDSDDSSPGSDTEMMTGVAEPESSPPPTGIVLGLRYSCGLGYVTDDTGQKLNYDGLLKYLDNAYSQEELTKHAETMGMKEAELRALIKQEWQQDEIDPEIKAAGSLLNLQEMAMKYIPEDNIKPQKKDPIHLFEHPKHEVPRKTKESFSSQITHSRVEFINLLEPRGFAMGKMDSLADIPSTIARRLSNETVRGSNLSTHLSDMPSTFSQALIDEPSMMFSTVSTQDFDITPWSVEAYREKWLMSFMSGFTPRETFTIRITNMITRKQVELRVTKNNTLNDICHLYMQFEDRPECYVWKDIYGRVLSPEKNLVENGLVRPDEVLEYQGYRRLPVILLYFRDGFENDPPLPLNPLHALRQKEPGLCRNY